MFDVGFSELLLIALVALVVFGPERLPKLVRETTFWIRKIRSAFDSAKTEIDRELQLMELKASMEERRQQFLKEAEALQIDAPSLIDHRPPIDSESTLAESPRENEHVANSPR